MTKKKKIDYWIPGALEHHKEGSTHRMLGVPSSEKIPFTLLDKTCHTPIGETAKNPTKIGKDKIKVTRLVKKRVCLALTLKRINKKTNKGK